MLARKPLVGTVAENVLSHGTGALHIDACRIGTDEITTCGGNSGTKVFGKYNKIEHEPHIGRWPANVLHDGSDEVVGMFPDANGGHWANTKVTGFGEFGGGKAEYFGPGEHCKAGSSARFFYSAKVSSDERNAGCEELPEGQTIGGGGTNNTPDDVCGKYGSIKAVQKNTHPTVKPVKLMEWLIRLITPKNGVVLDPFMGSGTTGIAAKNLGFSFVGIEISEEYAVIAKKRFGAAQPPLASFVAIEEVSRPSPQRTL